MAFIDNNGIINLYRGDCLQVPLFINIGTDEEPIRLDFNKFSNLDIEVYFGVYSKNCPFEHSFIRKKFTCLDANSLGDIIVKIDPQDTLCVIPGSYFYSVKLRMQDNIQGEFVSTVIDRNIFNII